MMRLQPLIPTVAAPDYARLQAHFGEDEDEEWWPGRALGVHTQGAHAGRFDVLYDDGELELFKPSRRVRLPRRLVAQAQGRAKGRAEGRATVSPTGGAAAVGDDDDGVEGETNDEVAAGGSGWGCIGGGGAGGEETPAAVLSVELAPAHKKRKVTASGLPPRAPLN